MRLPAYAIHVAAPVVSAGVLNAIIFGLKLDISGGAPKNPYLPPGYVVGAIWVVLFGLLGYAHYRFTLASPAIAATILFCLAYPILTSALRDPRVSRALNTATLVIACATTAVCLYESPADALLLAPLVAWAAYVNWADRQTL